MCCAVLSCSVVSDSATPGTVARQAPLSMEFSRQEYWSGLPCPPPGDLPNPGIKPMSPALQVDSLPLSYYGSPMCLCVHARVCVCVYETKRCLLLVRTAMANLDSVFKSKGITLLTKVHTVIAMLFPVVMDGYESWTIKKAESPRTEAFKLWCWRRLLRVPWAAGRSNQSILKEINPEYSLE